MFASARAFTRAVNITAAPRSSVTTTTTRAAAGDVWMPGSARPKYLDGSSPGCVRLFASSCFFFWFVTRQSGFVLLHLDRSNRIESMMMIHSFGRTTTTTVTVTTGVHSGARRHPSVYPSVYPCTRVPDRRRRATQRMTRNQSKIRAR